MVTIKVHCPFCKKDHEVEVEPEEAQYLVEYGVLVICDECEGGS